MSKYRLNVVLSLMFISLIINVCVAQAEPPLLDIPYDINLVDKEENINLNKFDTVNIDLPYVNIINKKLKEAIDNSDFVIRSHRDSINTICTYLTKTGKDIYELWVIIPALGYGTSFYNNNTIGVYQIGAVAIFIDKSARNDTKKIKNKSGRFTLLSDYEILNVDPVLILDLKKIYRDKVKKSPKMMQTHSKKK